MRRRSYPSPCTCRGGWPARSEDGWGARLKKSPTRPLGKSLQSSTLCVERRTMDGHAKRVLFHPPRRLKSGLPDFQQIDRPSRASPAWVGGGKKRTIATASSAAPAVARYVHPVARHRQRGDAQPSPSLFVTISNTYVNILSPPGDAIERTSMRSDVDPLNRPAGGSRRGGGNRGDRRRLCDVHVRGVGRKRLPAATWSSVWYMLSSFAVISYTSNWAYVVFAAMDPGSAPMRR